MTGLDVFDTTIHKTNSWLKEIMEHVGWEDRHLAYLALRGSLHALRDRLPVVEAVHLGAQLPMLARGLYYEGWTPTDKPRKTRSADEFLAPVREALSSQPQADPLEAARAVFAVLERHVTAGEVADVKQNLPGDIRELWPETR